jgi:hypothetical protein
VTVIVPSQANVTAPPPDKAELKAANVGVETTPALWPENGKATTSARIAALNKQFLVKNSN